MPKQIVISGYYGFGNIGDEAVLTGILTTMKKIDVYADITVLSADPARTLKEHQGVKAVHRSRLGPVFRAIRGADLLISGGGSLLQDATSIRSSYYYLFIIKLARLLRRKTMIYAQGVGPLNNANIRKAVAHTLNRVNLITVRDENSKILLETIGVKRNIIVTADPSFVVEPDIDTADKIIKDAGLGNIPLAGIALRHWPGTEQWIEEACRYMRAACEELGIQPVLIPMQEPDDLGLGESLGAAVLSHGGSVSAVKGLISRCEIVVGMRLHSLIFAASVGTPFVSIVYDPKVSSFAKMVNQTNYAEIGSKDPAALKQHIKQVWEKRSALRENIKQEAALLESRALLTGEFAGRLLG